MILNDVTRPDPTRPAKYTVSQKTSHLRLAITLTNMNGF